MRIKEEKKTYPRRVGSLRRALDLPAEAEVGDLADERRVHEDVPRREVPVHVVHLREILHTARNTAQHTDELEHLELAVIRAQESVQAAVLHEFGDYHHRVALRHDSLEEYHVGVLELTHYRGLRQEVVACLVGRAGLQCLYGHVDFRAPVGRQLQLAATYVPELTAT